MRCAQRSLIRPRPDTQSQTQVQFAHVRNKKRKKKDSYIYNREYPRIIRIMCVNILIIMCLAFVRMRC